MGMYKDLNAWFRWHEFLELENGQQRSNDRAWMRSLGYTPMQHIRMNSPHPGNSLHTKKEL